MEITFGFLAQPLTEQLKGLISEEKAKEYNVIANFICDMFFDDKLTDRQAHKCYDYLVQMIETEIKRQKEVTNV